MEFRTPWFFAQRAYRVSRVYDDVLGVQHKYHSVWLQSIGEIEPCPRSLSFARLDIRYRLDPSCKEEKFHKLCRLHGNMRASYCSLPPTGYCTYNGAPRAIECHRQSVPARSGATRQCCYSDNMQLIVDPSDLAYGRAEFMDHHQDVLQHVTVDILPRLLRGDIALAQVFRSQVRHSGTDSGGYCLRQGETFASFTNVLYLVIFFSDFSFSDFATSQVVCLPFGNAFF